MTTSTQTRVFLSVVYYDPTPTDNSSDYGPRVFASSVYYDPTPTDRVSSLARQMLGIGYYDPLHNLIGGRYTLEGVAEVRRTVFYLVFAGKAYVFDGQALQEFPSPSALVWPSVVADGDVVAVVGGMDPDYSVRKEVYCRGVEGYQYSVPQRSLVFVYGEDSVELVDDKGNTMKSLGRSGAALAEPGAKLVSRKPFKVVYIELG